MTRSWKYPYKNDRDYYIGQGISATALTAIGIKGAGSLAPTEASVEGNYANLVDSSSVGPGKAFTATQKANIYAANMARNGGILKSDLDGQELIMSAKSVRGVTTPSNAAQVDHIFARNPADPNVIQGSNSYSNAQVLSAPQNRLKSNR